jgi:hypothetical protein
VRISSNDQGEIAFPVENNKLVPVGRKTMYDILLAEPLGLQTLPRGPIPDWVLKRRGKDSGFFREETLYSVKVPINQPFLVLLKDFHLERGVEKEVHIEEYLRLVHTKVHANIHIERKSLSGPVQPTTNHGNARRKPFPTDGFPAGGIEMGSR